MFKKKFHPYRYLHFFPLLFLLFSCGQQEHESDRFLPDEGIHISDAYARPGSTDGNSAVYFLISNGYTDADTIESVDSNTAEIVEIHESYERAEGMMGMRYIEKLEIPARSTVAFQPGSFHVMLMKLKDTLDEGEYVSVTLHLKQHGRIDFDAEVRMDK